MICKSVDQLGGVNKIGKTGGKKVEVIIPDEKKHHSVIYGVCVDMTEREIKENIKRGEVNDVKRFKAQEGGNHSDPVLLAFDGNVLPARVFIGCLSFQVRNYQRPPLCCFRCQRYGHIAGVYLDIEKVYDSMWREGVLHDAGINGRMFYWIKDFLSHSLIQVRVGGDFVETTDIENGTPQGSVFSPVLFNVMMNDIFQKVHQGFGKSLFADDGTIWRRIWGKYWSSVLLNPQGLGPGCSMGR